MDREEKIIQQARQLACRLERISADSRWARRSSGYRGALLKRLEEVEAGITDGERKQLEEFLKFGYALLERAARERLR